MFRRRWANWTNCWRTQHGMKSLFISKNIEKCYFAFIWFKSNLQTAEIIICFVYFSSSIDWEEIEFFLLLNRRGRGLPWYGTRPPEGNWDAAASPLPCPASLWSKRSYLVFKALITATFLCREQAFIYTTGESLFDVRMQPTLRPHARGKRLGGEFKFFLCDVGLKLRGASLWWCETMEVWGKSHYPWQHTFESELWILLSLRDSEHSLQCKSSAVFLWCVGAFQSQKHYFRRAGLRSSRNERLCNQMEGFIRNAHKTTPWWMCFNATQINTVWRNGAFYM